LAFLFACHSGFDVIERSNSVVPVHYLNPIFYTALLSLQASLGKVVRAAGAGGKGLPISSPLSDASIQEQPKDLMGRGITAQPASFWGTPKVPLD